MSVRVVVLVVAVVAAVTRLVHVELEAVQLDSFSKRKLTFLSKCRRMSVRTEDLAIGLPLVAPGARGGIRQVVDVEVALVGLGNVELVARDHVHANGTVVGVPPVVLFPYW